VENLPNSSRRLERFNSPGKTARVCTNQQLLIKLSKKTSKLLNYHCHYDQSVTSDIKHLPQNSFAVF